MSQHYSNRYVDPTPVWVPPDSDYPEVQPDSAWPEVVRSPSPQQKPYGDGSKLATEPPQCLRHPEWVAARRRLNILWSVAMASVVVAAVTVGAGAGTLAVKNARNSCPMGTGTGMAPQSQSPLPPPPPPSRTPSSLSSPVPTGGYRADSSSFTLPLAPSAIQQIARPALACPTAVATGTYNSSAAFKTYYEQSFGFTNLAGFIAYDFADCVDACLSYNLLRGGGDECVAVGLQPRVVDVRRQFRLR